MPQPLLGAASNRTRITLISPSLPHYWSVTSFIDDPFRKSTLIIYPFVSKVVTSYDVPEKRVFEQAFLKEHVREHP